MDNRTFWLGLLGGIAAGAIIIGAGYFALRAYLPSNEDDPLIRMKNSFIETGTMLSRASTWDEILSLYREREPAPEPVTGVVS